jgi:hypothetical protein
MSDAFGLQNEVDRPEDRIARKIASESSVEGGLAEKARSKRRPSAKCNAVDQ